MAKTELAKVPTAELAAEVRRRQRRLPSLQRKREKLLAELEAVEVEIAKAREKPAELEGASETPAEARRGAPRGLRKGSQPHAILAHIAEQGPMGATSTEIRERFGNASMPLQTLKKRGLIEAEKPSGGGRGYIYTATKAGRAALRQ